MGKWGSDPCGSSDAVREAVSSLDYQQQGKMPCQQNRPGPLSTYETLLTLLK
jgi:hypothetical protein